MKKKFVPADSPEITALVDSPEKIRKEIMKRPFVTTCEYVPDPRKKDYFFFILRRKNDKRYGVSFDTCNKFSIANMLYNLKDLK